MRVLLTILLCLWAGVAVTPFANRNFQVWHGESGYSTYHEWPSYNDLAGHGLNDAWRHDHQSVADVYRDAVLAAFSDLKRWVIPPANAQSGRRIVLLSGVPSWVLRAGGAAANVDTNFATGQYYGCSLASCFSIVRASPKTNLLPSSPSGFAYTIFNANVPAIDSNGLLIEEARTNQLFNSTALVTQTTGSLANGTYTLWVNGTGTATMSAGTATGCGTGVASQGTPINFTTSGAAGTCTVTVAGTLQGNLELGAFGTSLIVTAGATATRAADSISAAGALLTQLAKQNTSVVLAWNGFPSPANQSFVNMLGLNGQASLAQNGTTSTSFFSADSSGANSTTFSMSPGNDGSPFKIGASWAIGARSLVVNGGTVSTTATSLINAAVTSTLIGSFSGTTRVVDTYIPRLTIWNTKLPDATLKALTQ